MRALILQFEADNPPEHLGARLAERGIAWDVVRMDLPHAPLSLDRYDMLIALGGSMHANEVAKFPFLKEATGVMCQAVQRGTPYLGVCLGGQLLARALGAEVRHSATPEIGVVPVTLDPAADDPLLRGLEPVMQTVQFHEDTFDIPEGGVLLAASADCEHQIVRCAERAYALQFHPEVSSQTFAGWIEDAYAAVVGDEAARGERALIDEVRGHESTARSHANTLIDNFIDLAAGPGCG